MNSQATRTLLFGIFVQAGRPLAAGQVVALARPLGMTGTNVKSHLTRLVQEGALERTGSVRRAAYAPAESQSAVVEGITRRLADRDPEPWDGAWLMLTPRPPATRAERAWLRASLWFEGFRSNRRVVAPGAYLRPAWPRKWALERARRYDGICIVGALLEPLGFVLLEELYQLDDLDRQAGRLARWVRSRKVPKDPARAFAERLKVGGQVARLVAHDPRLPPVLWGKRTGLAELVREHARFELRVKPRAARFLTGITARSR